MRSVLWLISVVFLVACHSQTKAQPQAPVPPVMVSVRNISILLQQFTIIGVEYPFDARIRCADQQAQKTFHDMRFLSEMVYVGRMIQPGEYYGVSYSECVCEGIAGYEIERRSSEVVVHCKKGG